MADDTFSVARAARDITQRKANIAAAVDSASTRATGGERDPTPNKAPASSFAPRETAQRTFGAPINDPIVNRRNAQTTDSDN